MLYLMEIGPWAGVGHAVVSHSLTVSWAISAPAYVMSTMMEPSGIATPDATEAATSKAATDPATTGSGMSFTSSMVMDSPPPPHDFQVALASTTADEGAKAARNASIATLNVEIVLVSLLAILSVVCC